MSVEVKFQPLTGCIGARVEGIDLVAEISAKGFAQIRQGLLEYLLREIVRKPRYHVRINWKPDDLAIWDNI